MPQDNDDSLFVSILVILLILPSAAWSGFVLTRLWAWFVMPLGVPSITVWQAAGLFILCSWLSGVMSRQDKERTATESLLLMALTPAFYWLIGGLYHWLMV